MPWQPTHSCVHYIILGWDNGAMAAYTFMCALYNIRMGQWCHGNPHIHVHVYNIYIYLLSSPVNLKIFNPLKIFHYIFVYTYRDDN